MRLKIGPYLYKVRRRKPKDAIGSTNVWRHTIDVSPDLCAEAADETEFHEALHAIFHTWGLDRILGKQEELFTRVLSPALILFLRDNRVLVSRLLQEEAP